MPAEITMPQLSDTMTEGTLVKWLKKEGEKVKEGDAVAEVETDKAVMPMESFDSGTLAAQLVKEGEKVKVGVAIAVIARAGEDVEAVRKSAFAKGSSAAAPAAANAADTPNRASEAAKATSAAAVVGASTSPGRTSVPAEVVAVMGSGRDGVEAAADGSTGRGTGGVAVAELPPTRSPMSESAGNGTGSGEGGRIRVSPLASRVAAERGIDLRLIRGSGPNGRIVLRDVENFDPKKAAVSGLVTSPKAVAGPVAAVAAAQASAAAAATSGVAVPPPTRPAGTKESVPLTKMRQVIAQRLQLSKQTIPHFYCSMEIDMEAAMALRERLNRSWEKEKIRLSLNSIVMKAVAVALTRHPELNAHFKDTEIVRFADVNLGVAVALPDGLIVPVLRGVQHMGLKEIQVRTADLAERARQQRLRGDEMTGGTFTISNLGAWGVSEFGAIINPPEVGILAVAAAEPKAVVHDGAVVVRHRMKVTLSGDHRAVDGANAAEFLRTLKGLLEDPATMLA